MPPILLINLARSPQRLKHSQKQLSNHNLSFERIDAIDGALLSEQEINEHYCKKLNKMKFYYPLSLGQIGCYLSHRKAWQTIVDKKLPYAIVLEDDFFINHEISAALKNIELLPKSWQLIKLAAYQNRTRPIIYEQPLEHSQQLVIHKKLMTGCCATAISYQGAKQLLSATEKFGRPVDSDLQHIWETNVRGYSLMPYPFEQDIDQKSDIAARSSNKIKKHLIRRKRQQLIATVMNSVATKNFVKETKHAFKQG